MKRMPKFTSRMFKPKMKRFGAAAPKMPKMPRVKKFQTGGDVEDEVIISPEEGRKVYERELARIERGRQQRRDQASKDLVKRYLSERAKADDTAAKKKAEEDKLRKQFDTFMEDRKKREDAGISEYMRQMKQGVRTAKSGGMMKSGRGDGIAKKGKTRGRYV